MLRSTVLAWKHAHPSHLVMQSTADNMLLLLDPTVVAETFPKAKPAGVSAHGYMPIWGPPARMCFAVSGPVKVRHVVPPPPASFQMEAPTSMTLRMGKAIASWTEDVCRILAACVTDAPNHLVELRCQGMWNCIPVCRVWCEDLGFKCTDAGLCSPGL